MDITEASCGENQRELLKAIFPTEYVFKASCVFIYHPTPNAVWSLIDKQPLDNNR